jgi:hypothetical protein
MHCKLQMATPFPRQGVPRPELLKRLAALRDVGASKTACHFE